MIYHDHCTQKPIVLPIYVRGIVWVFLSLRPLAPSNPPQTECFDCSRDITKRPVGRLLRLIVESLQRFIPTLERDKENYSGKLNYLRSHHTCAQHGGRFFFIIYNIYICSRLFFTLCHFLRYHRPRRCFVGGYWRRSRIRELESYYLYSIHQKKMFLAFKIILLDGGAYSAIWPCSCDIYIYIYQPPYKFVQNPRLMCVHCRWRRMRLNGGGVG